jgi:hypothetical protein
MQHAFMFRFTIQGLTRYKVILTSNWDYTQADVSWMNDSDFSRAEEVLTPSIDLSSQEFIFRTEREALECMARFYASQLEKLHAIG